jgi:hypothetical protein
MQCVSQSSAPIFASWSIPLTSIPLNIFGEQKMIQSISNNITLPKNCLSERKCETLRAQVVFQFFFECFTLHPTLFLSKWWFFEIGVFEEMLLLSSSPGSNKHRLTDSVDIQDSFYAFEVLIQCKSISTGHRRKIAVPKLHEHINIWSINDPLSSEPLLNVWHSSIMSQTDTLSKNRTLW